jgi:hypothetical protein
MEVGIGQFGMNIRHRRTFRFHIKCNIIISDTNMAPMRNLEIMLYTIGSVGITCKRIDISYYYYYYYYLTYNISTVCNVAAILGYDMWYV